MKFEKHGNRPLLSAHPSNNSVEWVHLVQLTGL